MAYLNKFENMLYGFLALQRDLIGIDEMLEAIEAMEEPQPLGEYLIGRGILSQESHEALAAAVAEYRSNANDGGAPLVASDSKNETQELPASRDQSVAATIDLTEGNSHSSSEAPSGTTKQTSSGERFRIIRIHARGGLGEISVAQDEQISREVALKEIQEQYADDPEKQQQFVLEGEVTGSLEHPGIVPVYALGHDARNRPFYAMRLIRGESLEDAITKFHQLNDGTPDLDRRSLPLRRLLHRFIAICNAIEYAHSRGVLHRDLKPANVMLGKYGETLVVDWGMARVIGRQQEETASIGEETVQATALSGPANTLVGTVKGTPAYMSPEQAMGQIDTLGPTSDVYSLGATLYCLLTNHPPFKANNLREILRRVEAGDFLPPRSILSNVPRPLNAICLKAMARVPSDRYHSSLSLAEDLERWLSDDAVLAYRERPAERLARWSRRHRAFVRAAVLSTCIVALIASMAALSVNKARNNAVALAKQNSQLAMKEAEARAEAVARLSEARQTVDKWLTGFSEAVRYYPGVQPFRAQMLQQAAADYENFTVNQSDDPALELERGLAFLRLGDVRRLLGEQANAEDAYQEALAVMNPIRSMSTTSKTAAGASVMIDAQIDWARCQNKLGLLHTEMGDFDRAQEEYQRAIELLQSLIDTHPEASRGRDALGRTLTNQGRLRWRLGRHEQAKEAFIQAARELKFLTTAHPTDPKYLVGLSTTQLSLGQSLLQLGRVDEASALFRQATQTRDVLLQLDENNPEYLQARADAGLFLASVLRIQGQYELEGTSYQKALDNYRKLSVAMPDVPIYQENLALTQTDYGQLLFKLGKAKEAQSELTKALALIEKLVDQFPRITRYHEELAVCLDNLGEAIGAQGVNEPALAHHERAETNYRQLSRASPQVTAYRDRLAICLSHQGLVLRKLGRSEAAVERFNAALKILDDAVLTEPDTPSYRRSAAIISSRLGDTLWSLNERATALDAYQNADARWKEIIAMAPTPDYRNDAAWFWANCLVPEVRRPDQAVIQARQAAEAAPQNPDYWGTVAAAQYRAGDFPNSETAALKAIEARGNDHARDLLLRSMAEYKLGKIEQARQSCDSAIVWMRDHLPGSLELQRLCQEATDLLKQESAIPHKSNPQPPVPSGL